jgi:hypothetical protein
LVVTTWPSVSTPDHLAHYAQEIASKDLLHIVFALESDDIVAKDRRRRKMIQTLSSSPLALNRERRFTDLHMSSQLFFKGGTLTKCC